MSEEIQVKENIEPVAQKKEEESANKQVPLKLLEALQVCAYVCTFKGRHKVENIYIVAESKEIALKETQQYCSERKLRWLTISPLFVNLKEKSREERDA